MTSPLRWSQAGNTLATLCATHSVDLMAIGNGTASRETEKLANEIADMLTQAGLEGGGGKAEVGLLVCLLAR